MNYKEMFCKLFITCLLFVSSFAFQDIKFNKPNCNLYYLNDIHKQMLRHQKSVNKLVIDNMITQLSKMSGQSVGQIKACVAPKRNILLSKKNENKK